jgi:hypothetical protein
VDNVETTLRINLEISLGLEWGDPRSHIEQTDENKDQWERMAKRINAAAEKGWVTEIPNDLPDISDYPLDDLYTVEDD